MNRQVGFVFSTLTVGAMVTLGACSSSKPMGGQGGQGGGVPTVDHCPFLTECGPSPGDFFDNDKVAELRITINDADVDAVRQAQIAEGYAEPLDTWLDVFWSKWKPCNKDLSALIPVTIEYRSPDHVGDTVLTKVGMRLRGSKARGTNVLQGFKLDVQALLPQPELGEERRKFAHLSKLNELSIEGDFSLQLQCTAYKLARDFDVPAPRCNHMSVYVNGEYYGLMQNIEPVDTGLFLKKAFDDNDGSLYACSAGCGYDDSKADLQYISDSFADYTLPASQRKYDVQQTLNDDPLAPEKDLIPMLKCGDVDTTPDDAAFKACIQEWIDVPEWLRLTALESLMPTLESFLGALRNYFLYFVPDSTAPHGGRFKLYSWDYDTALVSQSCYPSNCDPFKSVTTWFAGNQRAKLIQRLTQVFKPEYCQTMNDFLTRVYKPEIADDIARVTGPVVKNTALKSQYWPVKRKVPCPAGVDAPAGATFSDAGVCTYQEALTPEVWEHEVTALHDFMATFGAKMQGVVANVCSSSMVDAGSPAVGDASMSGEDAPMSMSSPDGSVGQ